MRYVIKLRRTGRRFANHTQLERIAGFFQIIGPEALSHSFSNSLTNLQRSLHFRAVTVASDDEAICIANLLSLDIGYILEVAAPEERMARVWALIYASRTQKGLHLPAKLVFFEDDCLDLPGWHWAPRTLLRISAKGPTRDMNWRVTVRCDGSHWERKI